MASVLAGLRAEMRGPNEEEKECPAPRLGVEFFFNH